MIGNELCPRPPVPEGQGVPPLESEVERSGKRAAEEDFGSGKHHNHACNSFIFYSLWLGTLR
jgi:hypothetical protein